MLGQSAIGLFQPLNSLLEGKRVLLYFSGFLHLAQAEHAFARWFVRSQMWQAVGVGKGWSATRSSTRAFVA